MAVREDPQGSFEDSVLQDPELEAELESRERAKEGAGAARKAFVDLDGRVKGKIMTMGIEGPARCGRFRITVASHTGRSVTFETKPSTRVQIKVNKE